jgi:DNA-binding response OmpR family regulator
MKVFILEDDPHRVELFRAAATQHDVVYSDNVDDAVAALNRGPFDVFLLDHDLGGETYVDSAQRNTGAGFCREAVAQEAMAHASVIVHSYNQAGAQRMVGLVPHAIWQPFGPTILHILEEMPS